MRQPRVYVDSGIIILASQANEADDLTDRAIEQLDRDDVVFLYSRIVELETLPAPTRNRQFANQAKLIRELLEGFERVPCDDIAQDNAIHAASTGNGLGTGDALHVGAAIAANADYILSSEKPDGQLTRCSLIKIVSIHDGENRQT